MFKSLQRRNTMVKIVLGVVLGLVSLAMVITLVPGPVGSIGNSPDIVARVGGQDVTMIAVREAFDQVRRAQSIPPFMQGFYLKQIADQMIFDYALEAEAKKLGIEVTPEEETQAIKQLLPTLFNGDTWVGKERYVAEVEQRTGMSVPEFEEQVRKSLLEQKFRQIVTAGLTVTPGEVEQRYRWLNERVQIEYALIQPAELASTIHPTEAELSAYFTKNQSRYQVPERRAARYALLDFSELRQRVKVSEAEIEAYYNANIDRYKVENRVHAEHILFKTIGKTDAEIAEIRQRVEEVLQKAKHGGNFEALAKQYSEDDNTKAKGGDLGWIVAGQTVPAFENAAFNLPKGGISELVQTPYGFEIIKVLDRETAHTKSLAEVRDSIVKTLSEQKLTDMGNDLSDKMAAAVRQSNRQPIETIAKEFGLEPGETPLESVTDPVGTLGNSPQLHDALFTLNEGELSAPIALANGYVVLTVSRIVPAHQGTLEEVRERVLADYRRDKSQELAETRAQELAERAKNGETIAQAAKALGLEVKTSDPFARSGQVPNLGPARALEAAFNMALGQTSTPTLVGGNWLVYQVKAKQGVNPDDLAKQQQEIEQQVLQEKQAAAFDAFRIALETRLRQEGKLQINPENLKRLASPS